MLLRSLTRPVLGLLGLCLFGQCLLAGTSGAQQGGIEVFAANTLFASGTRVSATGIFERKGTLMSGTSEVPDPLGASRTDSRLILGVDHGLRSNVTVSALFPWVHKDLTTTAGDTTSSGIGDVALMAKWRPYKRDWRRGGFQISAVGGVETPTGVTDESEGGMQLPPELQPGLGAWNPFVAITSNLNFDRVRFDGNVFYKENTEGSQDYEKGDFFSAELDAAYRFWHEQYPGPTAKAKVGVQWRREDRATLAGMSVANSGSTQVFLKTALSCHPVPNIDLSISADLPLSQDFNGTQLATDYRVFLRFGVRF
jgi:hypothetical protein